MEKEPEIHWSNRAVRDTDVIVEYLRSNWTENEVENFFDSIRKFRMVVIQFPEDYPHSKNGKVRKAVISRQNSIIYRVKSNTIQVITIINNRTQHPY